MLPKKLKAIDRYLIFAETCADDLNIMAEAIKNAGCNNTCSKIKKSFERYKLDDFVVFFDNVSFDDIVRAKRKVQIKEGKLPTLF